MIIHYPAYYADFRCLAGKCPHSCCRLWDIDVDNATAALYEGFPGPLGEKLRSALKYNGGTAYIQMTDGRCPLWSSDGLCSVQVALGHEALCKTCREYPRLTHDYGSFTEQDLELSCPEAARLIFENPAPEIRTEEVSGGDAPDYDEAAMAVLRRTRAQALSLTADTAVPMEKVLSSLLLYAYGVEEELDGGEAAAVGQELTLPELPTVGIRGIGELFAGLELLTEQWAEMLRHIGQPTELDRFRPVLTYFLRRYWLQAVSDGEVVCRVKFMIASCLLLSALEGNPTENACLFSKEVENDSENTDALLDAAYTHPALTNVNLLKILKK